jgi:hypothetical protein
MVSCSEFPKTVVADTRERLFLDEFPSEVLRACDFVVRQGPTLLYTIYRVVRWELDGWAMGPHSATALRRLLAAGARTSILLVEGAGKARCLEAVRKRWTREGVMVVETRSVQDTINFLKSLV